MGETGDGDDFLLRFFLIFFVVFLTAFLAIFLTVFLFFGREDLAAFFLATDFAADKLFFAKLVSHVFPISLGAPNM